MGSIVLGGLTQISMPATPVAKNIEWSANDLIGVSTSPFSGQLQTQDWCAGWLEVSVTLPPLTQSQAQAWIAWLLQAKGQSAVFTWGDPTAAVPQGTALGTPVANNATAPRSYQITTRGWTASQTALLLPGDWIQAGLRLYRMVAPAVSDTNGNATLSVWPQVRETIPDGTALIVNNPTGLWRLKNNTRKWSASEGRIYGRNFELREALATTATNTTPVTL